MDITKFLADGLLIIILMISVIAGLRGLAWRRWQGIIPYAIMAGLSSLLVGKLLSLVYQPTILRPFLERGVQPGAAYIDNPGFPSDHMLLAGVVVLAIYYLTPYRQLSYILGLMALVMGIARVVALVHTPLDIIGGAVAACSGIVWYRHMTKAQASH